MRRAGALAAVWIAAATPAAVAQAPASRSRLDIVSYAFRLRLPGAGDTIRAEATVAYRHASDTLALDLVGMTVDSAGSSVSGRFVPLPVAYDGARLKIALAPGAGRDSGAVSVFYHGAPRDGLSIGENGRGRWSAFGDNWPTRARAWLPTVDDPGDKAVVRWDVEAPSGWRVVANGRLTGMRRSADGRSWWTYEERRPIATYLMVIGAAQMTVSRHRPVISGGDTIPIEVWAYPEDSAFADSVPFRRVTEIVETLQRLIGPFPYEKLAHVESSTRFGGMENASAIFYPERRYTRRTMDEGVVRHETAHQWFGDAVTERDFHQLWLSEGFASYFDLVAGAALAGDTFLARNMREEARQIMTSRVVDRPVLDTAVTDLMQLLDENSYQKGAWFLHMLRGYVGESAFWTGIRDYYRTYRDSSVLSVDFRRTMERASGRKLGWFFDQWLRQPGYPQLDVSWSYDAAARAVTLRFSQVQPAAWGLFRVPGVELELRTGSRVVARRVVELSGARQTLRVDVPQSPSDVAVDPRGRLLLTATVRRGPSGR